MTPDQQRLICQECGGVFDADKERQHIDWHVDQHIKRQQRFAAMTDAVPAPQAQCKHGHVLDEANTYITKKGYPVCRTCHNHHAAKTRDKYRKPKQRILPRILFVNERGETFVGITRGLVTVLDGIDVDLALLLWTAAANTNYAVRRLGQGRPTLYLHRLILSRILGRELALGEMCDHINRNRLDNRRKNLRVVTSQQNQFNHGLLSTNTSGVTGVYFNEQGTWTAQIKLNGRQRYLGRFATLEEAAAMRRAAELEFFGEYSPLAVSSGEANERA